MPYVLPRGVTNPGPRTPCLACGAWRSEHVNDQCPEDDNPWRDDGGEAA